MTGAQHYAEAERLLLEGVSWDLSERQTDSVVIAAAQVHATLALAAATHDTKFNVRTDPWAEVLS